MDLLLERRVPILFSYEIGTPKAYPRLEASWQGLWPGDNYISAEIVIIIKDNRIIITAHSVETDVLGGRWVTGCPETTIVLTGTAIVAIAHTGAC